MSFIVAGTGYALAGTPVPQCFRDLDAILEASDGHFPEILRHLTYTHGANLCRRMGDVELYAFWITRELNPPGVRNAALVRIATSALLVGHYSACKAVLDASAMALTAVYDLGVRTLGSTIAVRDMDLAKGRLWPVLEREQPLVFARYKVFRALAREVQVRRDAAVHRLGPLVMPNNRRSADIAEMEITLAEEPDARMGDVRLRGPGWVEPLHYHWRWRPMMENLCDEVCRDLAEYFATVPPPPPPLGYVPL